MHYYRNSNTGNWAASEIETFWLKAYENLLITGVQLISQIDHEVGEICRSTLFLSVFLFAVAVKICG